VKLVRNYRKGVKMDRAKLLEIHAELKTAIQQTIPEDDQIIMDHVRAALTITKEMLADVN
jgi:hypothetical protein